MSLDFYNDRYIWTVMKLWSSLRQGPIRELKISSAWNSEIMLLTRKLCKAQVYIVIHILELQWNCEIAWDTSKHQTLSKGSFLLSKSLNQLKFFPIIYNCFLNPHIYWKQRKKSRKITMVVTTKEYKSSRCVSDRKQAKKYSIIVLGCRNPFFLFFFFSFLFWPRV